MSFNETFQFFTHPDGTAFTLAFANGPSGVVFTDMGNGLGSVVGTAAGSGPWSVDVTADDNISAPVTQTWTLVCGDTGGTAIISRPAAGGISNCSVGGPIDPVFVWGSYTSSNGNPVSVSSSQLPAGVSVAMNGSNLEISGTYPANSTFTLTFSAIGAETVSQLWAFQCENFGPQPPNCPNLDIVVGQNITQQFTFSDPENDDLTYSATGLPDGASIDPDTGLVTGTANVIGTYNTVITASDALNSATCSFVWEVVGSAPVSRGCPPLSTGVSLFFDPSPYFIDPDNNIVSYELIAGGPPPNPNTTNIPLSWDAIVNAFTGSGLEGTYSTTIRATDGNGDFADCTFDWTVS